MSLENTNQLLALAVIIFSLLLIVVGFLLNRFLSRLTETFADVDSLKMRVQNLEKFETQTKDVLKDIDVKLSKLSDMTAPLSDIKDSIKRLHIRLDESFRLMQDNRERLLVTQERCKNHKEG